VWTLILTLAVAASNVTGSGTALQTVPFATEAMCQAAADAWLKSTLASVQRKELLLVHSAVCVEVSGAGASPRHP